MEPIVRDFRLALRRLRMAPGFTIFAVVSLALGIGVSTAIYSAVRTLFWMPLSIAEPTRAVSLVIGVSKDTDTFVMGRRGNPVFFVPLAQGYDSSVVISARAADPSVAAGLQRAAIRRADPELAVSSLGTGSTLLAAPYFLLRIVVGLSSSLGVMALVLAMAGLYGVLAHLVARRTREIGIRIANGADRSRIFTLILRDGLRPVVKGLVLGLGAGVLFRIALRTTIVTGISPVDPVVFAVVPIPFVLAAVIACYVPASRASRVDPNIALRDL